MNPFVSAVAATLHILKRACPKCYRDLMVRAENTRDAMSCKYCGHVIEPNKQQRG